MVYTVDEISAQIENAAKNYDLKIVWLFGSYARNEAKDESDLDILIDRTDSRIKSFFDVESFREDIESLLAVSVDEIATFALEDPYNQKMNPNFKERVFEDCQVIYKKKS